MIRKSLVLALTAMAVSLLAHVVGLGLTVRIHPPAPEAAPGKDIVALGNSFEDLADAPLEPVFPDPAPTPEPETVEEPPAEPETTEAPTSDAKVASNTPKQTFAPDAPVAQEVRPELTTPVVPGQTDTQAVPEITPAADQPAEPADTVEPQQDTPSTADVQPVTPSPVTPQPEQLAALSAPTPPPPVTPPVLADPDQVDPVPEISEEALTAEAVEGQVQVSLRPRLPPDRTTVQPEDTSAGTGSDPARAPLIESPLTAYQRSGVNVFGRQSSRASSGQLGFSGSGGEGNADTTNYAGQVLVHLNRTPPVAVSGRGWARVFFEINPDGSLASVDVIDGSGSSEIDRAAKAQVRLGEPFPRPPNGQRRKLNFVYSIR